MTKLVAHQLRQAALRLRPPRDQRLISAWCGGRPFPFKEVSSRLVTGDDWYGCKVDVDLRRMFLLLCAEAVEAP